MIKDQMGVSSRKNLTCSFTELHTNVQLFKSGETDVGSSQDIVYRTEHRRAYET